MNRTTKTATAPTEQLALDFSKPPNPDAKPFAFSPSELPRDPAEHGYQSFHSARNEALHALEERFGLILNRRVRVTLLGVPAEFVGKLVLAQLLPTVEKNAPLRLRINDAEFDDADIETCVLLPD